MPEILGRHWQAHSCRCLLVTRPMSGTIARPLLPPRPWPCAARLGWHNCDAMLDLRSPQVCVAAAKERDLARTACRLPGQANTWFLGRPHCHRHFMSFLCADQAQVSCRLPGRATSWWAPGSWGASWLSGLWGWSGLAGCWPGWASSGSLCAPLAPMSWAAACWPAWPCP